jgi:hypothetical protein
MPVSSEPSWAPDWQHLKLDNKLPNAKAQCHISDDHMQLETYGIMLGHVISHTPRFDELYTRYILDSSGPALIRFIAQFYKVHTNYGQI